MWSTTKLPYPNHELALGIRLNQYQISKVRSSQYIRSHNIDILWTIDLTGIQKFLFVTQNIYGVEKYNL